MAGVRRSRVLALVAFLLAAIAGVTAQGQIAIKPNGINKINEADGAGASIVSRDANGSIAGRLTDLKSTPLGGATVVLRNEATGAESRTTSARNGSYRFTGLAAGDYTLEAESERLGRGRLEGIVVAAGHEARLQTAMEFEPERPIPGAGRVIVAANPVPGPPENNPSIEMTEARGVVPEMSAGAGLSIASRMGNSVREMPVTQTPALIAELRSTQLSEMAVSARPVAALVREIPAMMTPEVAGVVAEEAMQELTLRTFEMGHPQLAAAAQVAASDVDPVTAAVTTTLTASQLQGLPVGGRRWQDFVLDTPTATAEAGGGPQQSLRGAGQEQAETRVDGASKRLAFGNGSGSGSETGSGSLGSGSTPSPGGMGQAWAGGRGFVLGETAIREIQTTAGNVEAKAARAAGGRMSVATERGTNGLHGQAFLFDRQNIWGAQNPFSQWIKESALATEITVPTFTPVSYTPPDHEMTWGLGLGSQIRRDKLFWFAALDGYQRNDPGLATVKHPEQFFAQPSNDQMQVLSARLGLSGSNPVAEGISAYSKMLETLGGLLGPSPRAATQWVGFARMDWKAAERHRFSLEGTGATWNSPGGGLTRVSETYGANSFGTSEASEEWLLGRWEAFLTPNLLAVTQGSAGRNIQSAHAEAPSGFEQKFLSPSVWGQLPQIVVDSRNGFTIGNPSRFGEGSYPDEKLYEGQEMLDWVRGRLLVKAGFDLIHNADATSLLRNQTGTYSYSSVENFASDALAYAAFGVAGELDRNNQHNCDQTGKAWRDSLGTLRGLGYLPCYAYYSQVMGPTDWHLSTNDWAGYATAQWEPKKLFVVSAGLRWEWEQMPPPIAALANPELPLAGKMPGLGNDLGPRVSMAVGNSEGRWPVVRLGYGMYFGRTTNSTLETALTRTGSANGDLSFFMRPTDNLNAGGAPPFPYVLAGEPASMVKPGAVQFAPGFRNPEVHQALAAVEESLPGHVKVTASAMISLGRRLPVSIDANIAAPTPTQAITYNVCEQTPSGADNTPCGHMGLGPIKASQITVPFYASWPSADCTSGSQLNPGGHCGWINQDYQEIDQLTSKANSTYEAAVIKVSRYGRRGLSLHANYTYSHTMDWNPNASPLIQGNFNEEYGTSNQDMRHSAAAMMTYDTPWKLRGRVGEFGNGWMLSGVGHFHSGLPYTMRTGGSLAEEFTSTGAAITGLAPGMNGSGGDSRVYGTGSDNVIYNIGRNTYRYPSTWKADVRLGKSFDLGAMRKLELLVESFNLFNHQNVTELETTGYTIQSGSPPSANGAPGTPPSLNFLTGLKTNLKTGLSTTAFGQPLNINAVDFYRERQVQVGMRVRF